MSHEEAGALLASYGFLATTQSVWELFRGLAPTDGSLHVRWRRELDAISAGESQPIVFKGHQRKMSLDEMVLYNRHVEAAEEADEDFFGNFS
jgi:hypothetical protein